MIPMYRVGTPNVLLLATVRWTPVTVTIVPCQTPRAPKSRIDEGLKEGLYMSIIVRIITDHISGKVLRFSKQVLNTQLPKD
jgi:hypothetical protein